MNDRVTILLAEDREDDIVVIQRAFKQGGLHHPLIIVRDGDEAINYLAGFGRFSNRERYPIPALFLLDLTLPGTDGFEVLRWIRQRPELKNLPVIVLTASDRIRDVNQAYRLGAHSFLVKSLDFHDAVALAKSLSDYWLNLKQDAQVKMPPAVWPPKENLGPSPISPIYPDPSPPTGESTVTE